MQSLFDGPFSLREPSERLAFWLTALFAFPAALAIGYVLHESIGASQVALLIVVAMVYVTLARGRLLGSSVRVHERQYPRVFTLVRQACAALDIPMPLIFVREDNFVPVVALGFGEPYALVLSSHWIEIFADDELAFMVGRELGHIAAEHTRFHSLLSVNGNENPIVSLIFGAWLRRCALSCDKVGLLCSGSLDSAVRAMGIANFHEFGRKVDYEAFAEQHAEIQNDSVLRWGEWLSAEPYATRRIASLRHFMTTNAYQSARSWFLRERSDEPPSLAAPGTVHVGTRDCAGWWRRFAAWSIDAVVGSVVGTRSTTSVSTEPGDVKVFAPGLVNLNIEGKEHPSSHGTRQAPPAATAAPSAAPSPEITLGPLVFTNPGVAVKLGGVEVPLSFDSIAAFVNRAVSRLGFAFWFPIYLAALVIVAGQTFGMMIAGLRVVTVDYAKPSIARTIFRYLIVFALWWLIVPFSLLWRRILIHDRWSRTRLVKVERVVARIAGTP
jgi:Zn-dependent protease with chaperone function